MGERGAKKHPDDDRFCEDILNTLGDDELSRRSMFGGLGLFASGAMFAIVSKGRLFLKADDVNRDRFKQAGSRQHRPMPYWEVPDNVLTKPVLLRAWASEAIDAAQRAKKTPRSNKSSVATRKTQVARKK